MIDVIRTVDPEVSDGHRACPKHEVAALERPVAVGHVAHDGVPAGLDGDALADVLDDRTVESGLALGDRRARLTAHYAPVA